MTILSRSSSGNERRSSSSAIYRVNVSDGLFARKYCLTYYLHYRRDAHLLVCEASDSGTGLVGNRGHISHHSVIMEPAYNHAQMMKGTFSVYRSGLGGPYLCQLHLTAEQLEGGSSL